MFFLNKEKNKVFPPPWEEGDGEAHGNFEDYWFTTLVGLFMGVLTIWYIVWNRLFRLRLPREIGGELWSIQFWVILLLFILILAIFMYSVFRFQKKLRNLPAINKDGVIWNSLNKLEIIFSSETFLAKAITTLFVSGYYMLQFFSNYILGAPLFLWRYIYYNLDVKYVNRVLGRYIWLTDYTRVYLYPMDCNFLKRMTITTIVLCYLPRLLAFGVFVVEIVMYKKLERFYDIAPILLIPLGFISFRRMSYDLCEFELKILEKFYAKIISEEGEFPNIKCYIEYTQERSASEREYEYAFLTRYNTFLQLGKMFYKVEEGLWGLGFKSVISLILSVSLGGWLIIIIGWY